MVRSYRMLAASGALLLLAACATGFAAEGEGQARDGWGGLLRPASAAAVAGVVAVHAIVYASFSTAAKQARQAARAYALPDWLPAQVERVRGRASRFILLGAAVAVFAAGLGFSASIPVGWRVAVASFALGFNVVAFFVEYAGFVALHRLLAELKAQAGRHREAPATPPHDPEPMSI